MAPAAHPAPAAGFPAPFVSAVLDDALAARARVYGISGLQGTGKSTLAAQLVDAAATRGLRAAALSLDDFYLDRPERERLARAVHPLLGTRGPPGTHDLTLALDTLDALRAGSATRLPAFDKRTDRRLPREAWAPAERMDLVVFEGWCLGATPQDERSLGAPLNALERNEDRDGRWRRYCNTALAQAYPTLWQRIDRLLFLQPPGFEVVPGWRWEQECAPAGVPPTAPGMTRPTLERFVQHFERVSRELLRTLPERADAIVALDGARVPTGALITRQGRHPRSRARPESDVTRRRT
ncbi:kinase [Luteimonas sp. M1R5S18]|uniref:Kinase n=1 Tax=Luteimonas rhizosphaericola TaxID=3042024 RepID=A0ABT6JIN3_9GAMM|nr:kinase [Luteimonas rhizosphaericola]MDH5830325.1 kinase [Luteimonas rhizosphaericola]